MVGRRAVKERLRDVAIGYAGAQARRCLEIIAAALEKAGASLQQMVRTRTLLAPIEDWQADFATGAG